MSRSGECADDLRSRIMVAHDFYSGVLGLTKIFENGNPIGFMVLKKDLAEIHLALSRGHRPSNTNVAHMFVDDVARFYAICQAAGVRIIKALMDKDYDQRAFVMADPDGNRIDIGERIRR